jgi:hypothetical protein
MAKRYSGELVIRLSYRDNTSDYHCTVSRNGVHVGTVRVGGPAILQIAVDCPEAYDDTAHAALSFLDHDGAEIASYAATTDSGWHVGRSKETAWLRESSETANV